LEDAKNTAPWPAGAVRVLLAYSVAGAIVSTALSFYSVTLPAVGFAIEQQDGDVLV
jgi:hypothetical protein